MKYMLFITDSGDLLEAVPIMKTIMNGMMNKIVIKKYLEKNMKKKINSLIDINSAELLEQKGVTIKEIIQQIQDYE